jgi:hypothetical protein
MPGGARRSGTPRRRHPSAIRGVESSLKDISKRWRQGGHTNGEERGEPRSEYAVGVESRVKDVDV